MLDIEEEKEWESEHLEELGTCVRVTRRRTRSVAIVHEWFERLRRFGELVESDELLVPELWYRCASRVNLLRHECCWWRTVCDGASEAEPRSSVGAGGAKWCVTGNVLCAGDRRHA